MAFGDVLGLSGEVSIFGSNRAAHGFSQLVRRRMNGNGDQLQSVILFYTSRGGR